MSYERFLGKFIIESNEIESILNTTRMHLELPAYEKFFNIKNQDMDIEPLIKLVKVIQPDAKFRDDPEIADVIVGDHKPPISGPEIGQSMGLLMKLVRLNKSPYEVYCEYESIHPFTDGNGRSGRAIWAWQMINQHRYDMSLGFLQMFHIQALQGHRRQMWL